MSKKNFKDSPALAFINPQNNTHEVVQDSTHEDAPIREDYVRTQGRKGYKKPRINLAFDSVAFLDKIREYAENEGKSITQFVNDSVAYYIERKSREGTRKCVSKRRLC